MNSEDFEDTYYLDYSDGCVKLYDDADAFIYQSTLNEEDYFSALADSDIEVFEDNKTENIPLSKITAFIDVALDGDENAKRMFTKSMLYFRESSTSKLSESSMREFEVELLGDFEENSDYYTEEYFESSFTFNIKPVSIVSSIDTFDGEINITMNNGDKIEYKYNIDPSGRYSNKDSYEFTINGKSFPADGEEGFIYEIIHGYNEYLKINNN